MAHKVQESHHYPEVGSPFFWPLGLALNLQKQALELEQRNMKFMGEVIKTEVEKPAPQWASPNRIVYALPTFTLRDFSTQKAGSETPLLILPPYAGHTSVIADFQPKQSLVETLLAHGVQSIWLADWHNATPEMKYNDIDNYLAQLHVAVTDLGRRVHLVGLCQGGWMAALYAARFPAEVASLVLAGSPIDTQAGEGAIRQYADTLPFSFYEDMVAMGGGLMRGSLMLEGFKNLHPQKNYVEKYVELYEHIEDTDYIRRTENFERWYEYTINLPGRFYLQAVRELFRENRFMKGTFISLGQTLNPKSITCPVYLLAGARDDITPSAQVFNAEKYFGTPQAKIMKDLAGGGHIGLFMGRAALADNWPKVAAWLKKQAMQKAA